MKSIFRFWRELKRRNVLKGIISYGIFSWFILQVISVLSTLIFVPEWIGKTALISLLFFFPVWLLFSWYYDITSEGIQKTTIAEGPPDNERTAVVGKRLNVFILVFLSLAVLLLFIDRMRLVSDKIPAVDSNNLSVINSIAVLPFKDISAAQNQTYFADGLAEELINTLSKITSIRVTSRTSAFSFKDKVVDIPTIAKQLGVNYILEGSIRTQDSIIRVSVQLVDTKNDTYAWSQTWDKQLENIFQIQNEISTTVAQKLELKITGKEIPKVKKVDPKAYQLYLQAKYEMNTVNGLDASIRAEEQLKKALQIDSFYAPSWELLSRVYHYQNNNGFLTYEEAYPLVLHAGQRALKEDSTLVSTYDILATIAIDYENDYTKALRLVKKGLSIEPNNSFVLDRAAELALIYGDFDKALKYQLKSVALNPLDARAFYALGNTYYFDKNYPAAEEALKKSIKLNPNSQIKYHLLSSVLLFQGKPEEALKAALKEGNDGLRLHSLAMINFALGNKKESELNLNELIEKYEESFSFQVACTYAYFKDKDKTFEWLNKSLIYKDFGLSECEREPVFDFCKDDPRWDAFMERNIYLPKK